MGKYYRQYKKVGKITASLTKKLNCVIQRSVYASPGVINHIRKYHSKQLSKNVKENLYRTIENIIEKPDYIGIYRKRNESYDLELIKKIDGMLLLGLKIYEEEDCIFVTTLYPITKSKIENRLQSGRIVKNE